MGEVVYNKYINRHGEGGVIVQCGTVAMQR